MKQWNHINSDENPADDTSRGLDISDSIKVHRWFNGPSVLWNIDLPDGGKASDDPEFIIDVKSNLAGVSDQTISSPLDQKVISHVLGTLETRISNWQRMKFVIARMLKIRNPGSEIEVADVQLAEKTLIRLIQAKHFPKEVLKLSTGNKLLKSSTIIRLDPILDQEGIMRVGGRLHKGASLNLQLKHPIILPKKNIIVRRLIEWHHRDIEHRGRTSTLCELRLRGYWIINGSAQVKSVVHKCVRCSAICSDLSLSRKVAKR